MISIRIARELIRIARLLVAKDWTSDIQKKRPDLDAEAVNNVLRDYSDPKEQKMVAYWLLDKKTIDCPFDQNTSKSIDQAWSMLNDPLNTKLKLDFMKFRSPAELISFVNGQASSGGVRTKFNPDTEPAFSNKKSLGNGVVVYEVEDSKAGQIAVRKALDDAWGPNFNGWCLAARKSKFGPRQLEEFDRLTESQKERLGLYSEDDLAVAWKNWEIYSKTPKRAAFHGGKIFAFSASNKRYTVLWWDKNDNDHNDIPGFDVLDDIDFLKQYGKINIVMNHAYLDQNPELFDEVMQDESVKIDLALNSTSPEILSMLCDDSSDKIRSFVAMNLSTTADVLEKMSKDNSERVRIEVAKNPNTPQDILTGMWEDESAKVRSYAAGSRNTPVDILVMMHTDMDALVRSEVAGNIMTPSDVLAEMSHDVDANVRRHVARNLNITPDVVAMMKDDPDSWTRSAVCSNPNTPAEVVASMWNDVDDNVRMNVSFSDKITPDVLAKMYKDTCRYVRANVAGNPKTPSGILAKMYNDNNVDVRFYVACNPNTPSGTLAKMYDDDSMSVRCQVARNPNTAPRILAIMGNDRSYKVRKKVAQNPSTPYDVLEKLSHDQSEPVRKSAMHNRSYRRR